MCNEMMAFFKQNIDNLNLNEHFIICKAITVKYMCISTDECIIANVNGSNTKDRALYMIRQISVHVGVELGYYEYSEQKMKVMQLSLNSNAKSIYFIYAKTLPIRVAMGNLSIRFNCCRNA